MQERDYKRVVNDAVKNKQLLTHENNFCCVRS